MRVTGKKVYEARWDSIGPFEMIVQGRTKHLQAEVIGSDVTENVETEGIFFICFVALLDVEPYVLLEELNSCRETAFNSRHIVRQMRSLKTC